MAVKKAGKAKPIQPRVIDPTAPGGMSMAALRLELVEEYGWSMADAKGYEWPALIECVIESRRGAELVAEVREHGVGVLEPDDDMAQAVSDAMESTVEDDDDFSDIDDLLAEFEEPEPPCEGCEDPMCEECFVVVRVSDEPHPLAPKVGGGTITDLGTTEPHYFIGMPGTKDYIFDGHRGAGPSSAERWIACPASLGASRAFLETLTPNQQAEYAKGSQAARQGTTAHTAAEAEARVVLGELTPDEAEAILLELAIEPEVDGEAYNEEMGEFISEYVDLVRSFSEEGREVLIETRVEAVIPLLTATDGEEDTHTIAGALDLAVLPEPKFPTLVVGDLKYGEGLDVDPDSNPQIRIYALAVLLLITERYDGLPEWLTDVEYIIAQPRLGGIKTWTESVDDLLDWQDEVLSKALTEALAGQRGGAGFNPGDVQCQWCPARGSCPALASNRMDAAVDLFTAVVEAEFEHGPGAFPETGAMSDEELASLYAQARGVEKLAKDLRAEVELRMFRGRQLPGFVLVNYSPPRKWHPEALEELDPANRAEGILPEERADLLWGEPKMLTPTAAEKALTEEEYKIIEHLIDKPDKRPVVAPEGDRRSLWAGKPPEMMFEDES